MNSEYRYLLRDLLFGEVPGIWTNLAPAANRTRHYLFYFRDETFECDAAGFDFEVVPHGAKARATTFPI